ncbi:Enamine deaminase RidA, house cleaning of reactive enamine intermediates, YjgF/YER057c/UK114 family [Halorientalis persicus]|uniref:Enamine deaminase RidA, house cleaning of reactive enamine intermediates, YjgF/YER057c/UK114 family n=1 Tax=Halorientalis persicus TaxID=1367881 RepID=A0A1H8I4M3_9EURY|nr:RidA family protein [Halorientalis persicus]SEN63137.1 Enamine deaminase RidA, house cleaning of reactive enamine intermediates, YjgF/YER057c/UK114 family [Halorientalis persicus]
MDRQRVSSGTEWEEQVGYSRAVRTGDRVVVSGTTATDDDGEPVAVGDPYGQTKRALEIVESALAEAGASLDEVIRTRLYVVDADDWPAVGRAHREAFGEARPAATMVQVDGLIDPDLAVEIEAEAVVGSTRDRR